ICDVSGVPYVDSTGLGGLIEGLKAMRTVKSDLCLVGADLRILRIFEITGLDKLFSIYSTESDALRHNKYYNGPIILDGETAYSKVGIGMQRKQYSSALKAKIVIEALREIKTVAQLAAEHQIPANLITKWKQTALEGMTEFFEQGH